MIISLFFFPTKSSGLATHAHTNVKTVQCCPKTVKYSLNFFDPPCQLDHYKRHKHALHANFPESTLYWQLVEEVFDKQYPVCWI